MNVRMLSKHHAELTAYSNTFKQTFDVIILSEIGKEGFRYLNHIFPDYEYIYDVPKENKYGGIAIMVKKNKYLITERNDLKMEKNCQCNDCMFENCWIQLSCHEETFIIGGIYRHPKCNVAHFNDAIMESLKQIKPSDICMVAGDININLLNLDNKLTYDYVTMMLSQNFLPYITLPTRIRDDSMTLIDHIFTRLPNKKLDRRIISGNIYCDIADHLANYICLAHPTYIKCTNRPKVRMYSKKNHETFFEKLTAINWEELLDAHETIDEKYDTFLHTFKQAYLTSFPLKILSRARAKDKKWITTGIRVSIKHKNRLYKKYLSKATDKNKSAYLIYKNKLADCLKNAKNQYYDKIFSDKTNSVNMMWKHLGSILNPNKSKKQQRIPKLIVNGKEIANDQDIADTMNNYFCTIGPSLASKQPREDKDFNDFMTNKIEETIFLSPTSEHEIEKEIKKIKSNKSAGADNFSPRLIMKCSTFITKPLCIIYNHALESASYPTALKLAKVLALHKKNCKLLPENYRPISLLSCFGKMLEKIIY